MNTFKWYFLTHYKLFIIIKRLYSLKKLKLKKIEKIHIVFSKYNYYLLNFKYNWCKKKNCKNFVAMQNLFLYRVFSHNLESQNVLQQCWVVHMLHYRILVKRVFLFSFRLVPFMFCILLFYCIIAYYASWYKVQYALLLHIAQYALSHIALYFNFTPI